MFSFLAPEFAKRSAEWRIKVKNLPSPPHHTISNQILFQSTIEEALYGKAFTHRIPQGILSGDQPWQRRRENIQE